jgi:hypothetical protein
MTDQKLIEHWIQGCAVQPVMFRDGLVLNLEDYNELVISAPIRLTLPAIATSPVEVVSVARRPGRLTATAFRFLRSDVHGRHLGRRRGPTCGILGRTSDRRAARR